jgi:APA family basic amino acid/polyamine antiporter
MHKKLAYKTLGYPIIPMIYLALNAWMLYFTITNKPMESLYGLINVAVGAIVWVLVRK